MFGPAGHAYVYRSYGMHWCVNIVCGGGNAAAILLRALQPTHGLDRMAARRGLDNPALLCAGPGRLCQALGITRDMDGAPIYQPPFGWIGSLQKHPVIVGPRIGITKGVETPWRFCLANSRFLSKPARGEPHAPIPHTGA
jgi:DNA-3-methyladenine glycosylase